MKKKSRDKLDRVFSKWIRIRFTDDDGYGECFTCGVRRHWKEVDAGHFMGRAKLSTRWDERNVQFQCKRCNMTGGQQFMFAKRLDEVYGSGTAEELLYLSNQLKKWSIAELEEEIRKFERKIDEFKRTNHREDI